MGKDTISCDFSTISAYAWCWQYISRFVYAHYKNKFVVLNHTMVDLDADKLKKQWWYIVYFANCVRQPKLKRKPPRPSYNQNLAVIVANHWISVKGLVSRECYNSHLKSCKYTNHSDWTSVRDSPALSMFNWSDSCIQMVWGAVICKVCFRFTKINFS